MFFFFFSAQPITYLVTSHFIFYKTLEEKKWLTRRRIYHVICRSSSLLL